MNATVVYCDFSDSGVDGTEIRSERRSRILEMAQHALDALCPEGTISRGTRARLRLFIELAAPISLFPNVACIESMLRGSQRPDLRSILYQNPEVAARDEQLAEAYRNAQEADRDRFASPLHGFMQLPGSIYPDLAFWCQTKTLNLDIRVSVEEAPFLAWCYRASSRLRMKAAFDNFVAGEPETALTVLASARRMKQASVAASDRAWAPRILEDYLLARKENVLVLCGRLRRYSLGPLLNAEREWGCFVDEDASEICRPLSVVDEMLAQNSGRTSDDELTFHLRRELLVLAMNLGNIRSAVPFGFSRLTDDQILKWFENFGSSFPRLGWEGIRCESRHWFLAQLR